jgi:hypothetical protein
MLAAAENGGEAAVYLEGAQSAPDLSPCQSSADEVAYELDDPDEVQLKLSTKCPGYFVLTDLYYPGWQASIDGKPSDIYRANFAFRAIKIEPGQHAVRFSYQPLTMSIGFPLSAVTCICVIVYIIVCGLVGIPRVRSARDAISGKNQVPTISVFAYAVWRAVCPCCMCR